MPSPDVGESATPPAPTHFYSKTMKKVYDIQTKPHLEQVLTRVMPLRRRSTALQKEIWRYRVARGVNSGFPEKASSS